MEEVRNLHLQHVLNSLDEAIRSLLDVLIEISIFIREYLHHSFVGKTFLVQMAQLLMMD